MTAVGPTQEAASTSSTPLHGRDDELQTISGRIAAAPSNSGSVLTVMGEPGLGKTRLLKEAARMAERSGMRFAYAAAEPPGRVLKVAIHHRPLAAVKRFASRLSEAIAQKEVT